MLCSALASGADLLILQAAAQALQDSGVVGVWSVARAVLGAEPNNGTVFPLKSWIAVTDASSAFPVDSSAVIWAGDRRNQLRAVLPAPARFTNAGVTMGAYAVVGAVTRALQLFAARGPGEARIAKALPV